MSDQKLCECGSGSAYASCCQPFIKGISKPETPEQLMRSRYTAYTQGNIDYIMATMRGMAAKNFNPTSAATWARSVDWQKLEIISTSPIARETGFVEFKAYFYVDNQLQLMHETSKFKFIGQKWFYVSGHSH